MTKHKRSRRSKRRGGGLFGPDQPYQNPYQNPYQQNDSLLGSLSKWWSSEPPNNRPQGLNQMSSFSNSMPSFSNSMPSFSNSMPSFSNPMSSYSNPMSSYSKPMTPYANSNSAYQQPLNYNANPYGGKGKSKTLKLKGGKGLGLTYYATPVSGLKVAEPTTFLKYGGKGNKSRRHKKR